VRFAPNGQTLWAGGLDGKSREWDVNSGSLVQKLGHHNAPVECVALSFQSNRALSATPALDVRLWDAANGEELFVFNGHADIINDVAFSRDGRYSASCSGSPPPFTIDPSVRKWSNTDGSALWVAPGHAGGTRGVEFASDGTVLSGGWDGAIKYWRGSDGALLKTIAAHPQPIDSLSLSPDGLTLASGSQDRTIKLWRVSDGALLKTLTGNASIVTQVEFAPDGQSVAGLEEGYGPVIHIWRVSDGVLIKTFAGDANGFTTSIAWSPSGTTLLSSSGYTHEVRFWRVSDGAQLQMYDQETGWGQTPVLPLATTPDGASFLMGRGDATLVLAHNPLP